jgi:hypothetical protein
VGEVLDHALGNLSVASKRRFRIDNFPDIPIFDIQVF